MTADLDALKAACRTELRALRRALAMDQGEKGSRRASDHLVALLISRFGVEGGDRVALYRAHGSEIDPQFAFGPLLAAAFSLALPSVVEEGRPLRFKSWAPGEELITGFRGLEEPAHGVTVQPQAVVLPLLGFDDEGHRIGQGGGFYDRTLDEAAPRPLAIGFAWAGQRCARLPFGPKDQKLDFIVTERGVTNVGT
ncbi:MAG: 5-formyltetrahydrofolate cyclo-ligase [Magnetovibrionaceae bacterium]